LAAGPDRRSVSAPAIVVRGLRKSYGGPDVVCGIDLEVRRGEVFALLGPNGAGKTTTVEILEGFRERSAGEVAVLGHDPGRRPVELRSRMGVVLQETGVDPYLNVEEVIDQYRSYFPHPRPTDEILELVGLVEQRSQRVRRLSGGQKRRLDVGIGLAGDPELLFLDEPTTGFDPSARRNAWQVIANLKALGTTVLLTTHYLDEAQALADRVAVIVGGRIVEEGPPAELGGRQTAGSRIVFKLAADAPPLPPPLAEARQPSRTPEAGRHELSTDDPLPLLARLAEWASAQDVHVDALEVIRPSLEDVYLQLTADAARSSAEDGGRAGRRARSRRAARAR
jgi:ABC-2 type transport system ATP-binding protein